MDDDTILYVQQHLLSSTQCNGSDSETLSSDTHTKIKGYSGFINE